MNRRRQLFALGAAALLSLAARRSFAVDCASLPSPIYLTGSTAFQTAAAAMGKQFAAQTPPVTLIYENKASGQGSATGALAILDPSATVNQLGSLGAKYTDATGAALTCDFTTVVKADVGVSDAYWETFQAAGQIPSAKPATIKDVLGPIQAYHIIVPKGDTTWGGAGAGAISAEQAVDVWGCGANAMLTGHAFPDISHIFVRGPNSGTQAVVATAIGLDTNAFMGTTPTGSAGGSDNMRTAVSGGLAGVTIGFLAADNYDKNRDLAAGAGGVDALAFRAKGQTKAYFADSSFTAKDKRNVRDGHYGIWGPEHFFVTIDNNGMIVSAGAQKFVNAITTSDFLTVLSGAKVIPQCAMKVQKPTDGGLLSPYMSTDPCGCYFESVATGTATPPGCVACTDNTACTASGKTCHHNFCE
jgi:ABC-type phosphate transport system substrate-binding protein